MVETSRFNGDLLLPRLNGVEHTDAEGMHTWVELRDVPRILGEWKEKVLDDANHYTQVQECFGQTGWYLNDTIYTFTTLAEHIGDPISSSDLAETDGFLRTAVFACQLVAHADPFELPSQPKVWKLDIAVRLFLTVFRDLRENRDGFFAQMLGAHHCGLSRDDPTGELHWQPIILFKSGNRVANRRERGGAGRGECKD